MALPHPPQQLRAKRTRRELLGAACEAFARLGYEGATVEAIAQAAGCSKGAYYFHFASKEEVFLALVDAWIADRSDRLAQATRRPQEALLPSLARALSRPEVAWDRELLIEFWSQARRNERVGERLSAALRSWLNQLSEALAKALPPGFLADELAGSMLALADGLALQSSLRAGPEPELPAEETLAAFELLAWPAELRRAG